MPADKALVDPFKVYSNVAFRAGTVSIFPSSGLCCKQKEMVKKKKKKSDNSVVLSREKKSKGSRCRNCYSPVI